MQSAPTPIYLSEIDEKQIPPGSVVIFKEIQVPGIFHKILRAAQSSDLNDSMHVGIIINKPTDLNEVEAKERKDGPWVSHLTEGNALKKHWVQEPLKTLIERNIDRACVIFVPEGPYAFDFAVALAKQASNRELHKNTKWSALAGLRALRRPAVALEAKAIAIPAVLPTELVCSSWALLQIQITCWQRVDQFRRFFPVWHYDSTPSTLEHALRSLPDAYQIRILPPTHSYVEVCVMDGVTVKPENSYDYVKQQINQYIQRHKESAHEQMVALNQNCNRIKNLLKSPLFDFLNTNEKTCFLLAYLLRTHPDFVKNLVKKEAQKVGFYLSDLRSEGIQRQLSIIISALPEGEEKELNEDNKLQKAASALKEYKRWEHISSSLPSVDDLVAGSIFATPASRASANSRVTPIEELIAASEVEYLKLRRQLKSH